MKRFADVSFINMKVKNQSINSRNTLKANRKAANTLREYLKEKEMDTDFVKFSETQLAEILSHFYMDARRPDGEHYKIGSLQNFRYSLNRYLRSSPYNLHFDIIKDQVFTSANNNFRMAVAELQKMGKDKVEHRPLISHSDLKKLYESIHSNYDTPVGLYNKVQFDVRLFFFRRGIENLNVMTKSTLKVVCDPYSGLKYVTLSKEKTKSGGRDNRHGNSAFSNIPNLMPELVDTPLCPVKSFEKYLSKLHPLCDRLWQRPRETVSEDEAVWFYNSPVGERVMAGFMKKLSRSCSLSTIYTNHSIRATGLSLMSHSKFNTTQGTSQNRETNSNLRSSKSSLTENLSLQSALYDNPISSLLQSIEVNKTSKRKRIHETTTVILSSSGDSSSDELATCNQSEEDTTQIDNGVSSVKDRKKKMFDSSFVDRKAMKRTITNISRRRSTASKPAIATIKHKLWPVSIYVFFSLFNKFKSLVSDKCCWVLLKIRHLFPFFSIKLSSI